MKNRSTQPNDASFPFIGLSVFLLTVALIVGWLGFSFYRRQVAMTSATRMQISFINDGISMYIADCGRPPTGAQGLVALFRNPGVPGWSGPYIAVPPDPWGSPYQYAIISGIPTVSSYGPDGVFGTPDDL